MDRYIETFKKTPLISLLHGKKHIEYLKLNAAAPIGWRQDCLGDLGYWAAAQNGWTLMYDYYPQTIVEYNMQDAWKRPRYLLRYAAFFIPRIQKKNILMSRLNTSLISRLNGTCLPLMASHLPYQKNEIQ